MKHYTFFVTIKAVSDEVATAVHSEFVVGLEEENDYIRCSKKYGGFSVGKLFRGAVEDFTANVSEIVAEPEFDWED